MTISHSTSAAAGRSIVFDFSRIQRRTWFIIGLAAVVLLAAVLRLTHTDWGLPFVEYPDETHLYYHGQARRGLYDPGYTGIYPPLFVWMNILTQQVMESLGQPGLAPTVHALRVQAAIANTLCAAAIGVAAYLLAGSIAGWFAAGAWALSGYAVEHALYAIPEPFVYLLVALCLLLAAGALSGPGRWRWTAGSLVTAALTFLFEYRMFILFLPSGLVILWHLLRGRRLTRRRWLILALALLNAAVGLLTVLFFVVPISYRIWLGRVLLFDLWDKDSLWLHILEALRSMGEPTLIAAVMAAGVAAWFAARRGNTARPDGKGLLFYAAMFLLICWVMSAVRWQGDLVRSKNTLVAAIAGMVLLGAAVEQVVRLLPRQWLKMAAALVAAGVLFIPLWQTTTAMLNSAFTGISWQVVIRQWADINVTPGTVIVYRPHEQTFNPFWGGIPHRYWFDWWPTKDITEHSLEEWRERGMSYALIPIPQHRTLEQSETGRAYLAGMLRLRDFVHPPARRQAEGIFYRLWRMDIETAFRFGETITLAGYDRDAETLRPGDTLRLRFYWQAGATPADNYSLFIHLVPEVEYTVLSQADGAPAVPERPTLTWDMPNETIISPVFDLVVPADTAPGQYRILIGLYNFQTGQRLMVSSAAGDVLGDALELMTITVESG